MSDDDEDVEKSCDFFFDLIVIPNEKKGATMTAEPEKEYIITEALQHFVIGILTVIRDGGTVERNNLIGAIDEVSRLYPATTSAERVLDELFKHIDPESPCGKVINAVLLNSNAKMVCPHPQDVPACKCCESRKQHALDETCFTPCFFNQTCIELKEHRQQKER